MGGKTSGAPAVWPTARGLQGLTMPIAYTQSENRRKPHQAELCAEGLTMQFRISIDPKFNGDGYRASIETVQENETGETEQILDCDGFGSVAEALEAVTTELMALGVRLVRVVAV